MDESELSLEDGSDESSLLCLRRFYSYRVYFSLMTNLTRMVLGLDHLVRALFRFLKFPLVVSVEYFYLVESLEYFHLVDSLEYFQLVESLEYFHLVESLEYFNLVESIEYFDIFESIEYFDLVESIEYFRTKKTSSFNLTILI